MRALAFVETGWVHTGLCPDPRVRLPPPSEPPIVDWELPPNTEACFAGECFGDGCCLHLGEPGAARAGWAVLELYTAGEGSRPVILRYASGTLPGPWQDIEGAELYALYVWLRHLDLLSPRRPVFYTDCRWVADGWNGLWDVTALWTPHWHLWQGILTDSRTDIVVVWTRGHSLARAAAQPGRLPIFAATGNKAADKLAKLAARRHPWPEGFAVSLNRTHQFSVRALRHFVQVIELGLADSSLPSSSVLRCLWPKVMVPSLPAHTVATSSSGKFAVSGASCRRACSAVGRACRPGSALTRCGGWVRGPFAVSTDPTPSHRCFTWAVFAAGTQLMLRPGGGSAG